MALAQASSGRHRLALMAQANTRQRRWGMAKLNSTARMMARNLSVKRKRAPNTSSANPAAVVDGPSRTTITSEDSDGALMEKLLTAASEARAECNSGLEQAATWRREVQELEQLCATRTWRRWEQDQLWRHKLRIRQLQTRISVMETVVPRNTNRHEATVLRIGELLKETNGTGRRIAPRRQVLQVQRNSAKDPTTENAARQEMRLCEDLLTMSVAHTFAARSSGRILSNNRVCPRCCGSLVCTANSQLLCTNCTLFLDANVLITSAALEGGDASTSRRGGRGHSSQYRPEKHFLTRLSNVQAHYHRIRTSVIKDVCLYLYTHRVPDHDLTNVWVGREALAGTNHAKLYEFVPLIMARVSGIQPPQLPSVTVHEMSTLIKMLHRAWRDEQRRIDERRANQDRLAGRPLRPTKRNHPNAGFCLQHLGQLRGLDELLKGNWSIWEPSNVRNKGSIMEAVFRSYGWEYSPVVVPRIAGPAKGAVERRTVACVLLDTTLAVRTASDKNVGPRSAMEAACPGAWQELSDTLHWVTFWEFALSEFNPWERCPGRVQAAKEMAQQFSVAHVYDALCNMEGKEVARQKKANVHA